MTRSEGGMTGSAIAGDDVVSGAVTPRWEWRTFSRHLAPFATTVVAGPVDAPQDEVYLVAAASRQNVKIRRDAIEIKRLEESDADGLERWRPVAQLPFPLGRAALDRIGAALGVVIPGAPTALVDRAALLDAVATMQPNVLAVPVTKQRRHFVAAGCRGERADLQIAGSTWQSIALEDEDPAVVRRTLHLLQLDHLPNTSYPAALKAIAGIRSIDTALHSPEVS